MPPKSVYAVVRYVNDQIWFTKKMTTTIDK